MLTSLTIKNFRGFKELKIEPLKRVNLLIGQNNTGKTAVLEALALLLWQPPSGCANLPTLFRVSGGDTNENFWKWLFYDKKTEKAAELRAGLKNNTEFFNVTLKKQFSQEDQNEFVRGGHFPIFGSFGNIQVMSATGDAGLKVSIFSTRPTDPKQDAIDYNRVILRRKRKQVEGLLQKIEPRLQTVETLQTGSEPLLYADVGLSELIPVTQLGQGFNRLLDIYSEIVSADAKVLLVDEIENGLHHSVLATVWKGLFEAAKEMDVQIFATTHSWECVLAADRAAREQGGYPLNLVRLDRVDENIKATVIDEKALDTAKELNWEMR